MHRTVLDEQWDELMSLCRNEMDLKRDGTHPKLLAMVARQIERSARKLGFGEEQIRTREFRAEKRGGHVVRILTGQTRA